MPDNNYRIAWIGEKTGEKKVVTYFNYQYYKFGWYPTSASISATDDGRNIVAYSDSYGSVNKFAHIWWYQTYKNLNISGSQLQLSNGSSMSNMYAESFQNSTAPYSFSTSTNLNSLSKTSNNKVLSGREAIVSKDSISFYYLLGDVLVDNVAIEPKEIKDVPDLSNVEKINTYLGTETFNLKDDTEFTYSVIYGVTDSILAIKNFNKDEYIKFSVELIQVSNNKVLGTYSQKIFDKNSITGRNTEGIKINPKGIGNREVYLRLVVESNVKVQTAIANIHSDEGVLYKQGIEEFIEIPFTDEKLVTEYELTQNYPNPFNPQTTINYQLPRDGMVTLKIYDMLGEEVTTLVNEFKTTGRYNIIFDGSNLASGVYFYRLEAGNFSDSKKFILMK